jgi:hypothetical protein
MAKAGYELRKVNEGSQRASATEIVGTPRAKTNLGKELNEHR